MPLQPLIVFLIVLLLNVNYDYHYKKNNNIVRGTVNMCRSILKITALCLVLFGNLCSFGMIVRYKNEDHKKAVSAHLKYVASQIKPSVFDNIETKLHIINRLDNPLVFGQTNKENHGLVKYEGLRNVCLAQKMDRSFVLSHFLLSHYVPILLIDYGNKRDSYNFSCIDSYRLVKMANNDYYKGDMIISLRNKRLKQALKQKKVLHGDDKVEFNNWSLGSSLCPLAVAALFGDSQKIAHELNVLREGEYFSVCGAPADVHQAIKSLIVYPSMYDNNALETIVAVEKEMRPSHSHFTSDLIGLFFYQILFDADKAKNKKAFNVLVAQRQDDINIVWVDPYAKNRCEQVVVKPDIPLTTLDRMIEEGGFDPENIALFRQCGGKTMKDLTI